MNEENLIFIISQPRSGSTYLQNLLSNNDQVNTCSEPWILLNYANLIRPKLIEASFDNSLAVGAFYNYKEDFETHDFNTQLKQHLLSNYEPLQKSFTYVIDKTPRYWELIDEIALLFPKAKIIVLKRDPIAVVHSLIRTYKMKNVKALVPFKRDLLYAPKKLSSFCDQNQNNNQVYTLRYEDLLDDTQKQTQLLYEWIGLKFDKSVLDVSANTKYRGHFGDPLQNNTTDYSTNKSQSEKFVINSELNSFINGYAFVLGSEFLEDYGHYTTSLGSSKDKIYKYYVFLCAQNENGKDFLTFKNLLKKMYFALRFS